MSTLLDLLYRADLYRRWCETYLGADTHRASDRCPPSEELLDRLLSVNLDSVRPEQAAATIAGIVDQLADLPVDVAVRQLMALRTAVLTAAPDTALVAPDRGLAAFHSFVDLLLAETAWSAVERLRQEATTDPLTRLANRRRLLEDLRREVSRTERTGRPLTVVVIDIDHLKSTNDVYGHHAGDERIIGLAERIRLTLRESDGAYRVGGDEFVLLLPDTAPATLVPSDPPEPPAVLQRLADYPELEFSWGIASCPADGTDPEALMKTADRRLIEQRQHVRGERR